MRRRKVDKPEPEPKPEGDGQVWFDFIAHELAAEHAQRAWLDARGTAIITSSGVVITAVFALGAFVLGKSFTPDGLTTILVGIALGSFILAALTALWSAQLLGFDVTSVRTLRRVTGDEHWWVTSSQARRDVAAVNVTTVHTLRDGNQKKAFRLTLAAGFQLLAMMSLGAGLLVALVRHR